MSAQVTATVSVTLVLLLLGILAVLGTATRNITHNIRENTGFNIVLVDSLPSGRIETLCHRVSDAPYVSSCRYVSADEALAEWRRDTGEDLMEILQANPFSSEIEVKVRAGYADPDSIAALVRMYSAMPDVRDVEVPSGLVDAISRSIKSLTLGMSIVALLLLIISFVLINNTVHLTVYSRRFTIHTMQLVGATDGFIRKPFIVSAVASGLVAGFVADILLALSLGYLHGLDAEIPAVVGWGSVVWVFVSVPLAGVVINTIATAFATHKYLRKRYDEMFS